MWVLSGHWLFGCSEFASFLKVAVFAVVIMFTSQPAAMKKRQSMKLLPCSAICILREAEIVFSILGTDVPTQTRHQLVTRQLDAY